MKKSGCQNLTPTLFHYFRSLELELLHKVYHLDSGVHRIEPFVA